MLAPSADTDRLEVEIKDRQVVVVGAGPAGISTALALEDVAIRALVLDKADQVASSWRGRYDRLRLNTCRPLSHLPNRPFPKGTPMFPSRDQLIEHHQSHADESGVEFRFGTRVERIDHADDGWLVQTADDPVSTRQLVIATGYENTPLIPGWEGREDFEGELLHSGEYRNPEPFVGKRVLVVGPGCSGMEIAYDLAEGGATKVWLSARTPPNILMRQGPAGLPGDVIGVAMLHLPTRFGDAFTRFGRRMDVGDLTEYGLPVPEEGVMSRLKRLGVAPAIVDREVIEAIKDGRIEVVRGVEELDSTGVKLADGVRIEPDVVIAATGYRRGLEPLVGHLGVLDERGMPRTVGEKATAPGMRFIGYVPRPGGLGYMAKQAKRAAKAIARELSQAEASREGQPTPA
jgi:cation diffusion facilitator CzcD-associated flavoprotein CzcO